jgi:hypothetical protein
MSASGSLVLPSPSRYATLGGHHMPLQHTQECDTEPHIIYRRSTCVNHLSYWLQLYPRAKSLRSTRRLALNRSILSKMNVSSESKEDIAVKESTLLFFWRNRGTVLGITTSINIGLRNSTYRYPFIWTSARRTRLGPLRTSTSTVHRPNILPALDRLRFPDIL